VSLINGCVNPGGHVYVNSRLHVIVQSYYDLVVRPVLVAVLPSWGTSSRLGILFQTRPSPLVALVGINNLAFKRIYP
jgi:hypothetical protein